MPGRIPFKVLTLAIARSRSSDQIRAFCSLPCRAAWSSADVRLSACMHGAEVDMKTSPLPSAGLNGIGQPFLRAVTPPTRQASHTGSLRLQQQAIQQAQQQPNGSTVCCASATEAPASARSQVAEEDFTWKGSDEFSELGDREDAPPLQLPAITSPKRIVLVRHGQSTWNAEGRVQGSSDFSYLTKRGQAQADTTRILLEKEKFDMLIHSPLQRAKETAEIVWNTREGPVKVLPSLREIDLYSFQGLIKQQGKDRYGEQYRMWQKQAAEFMIDGRAPVRELWHRASLAWQQTLNIEGMRCALVVAHNAVNQAMIATATGLPPSYFRRLLQSNGATTVLDFQPQEGGPPMVTLDRLNQSPGPPFTPEDSSTPKPTARIVMIRHGATYSTEDGLLLGRKDEALTPLGEVQANKTAELLMDMKIDALFSSPLKRSADTARAISKLQSLTGFGATPLVQQLEELTERDFGDWEGEPTARLRSEALSDNTKGGEPLSSLWDRVLRAWKQVVEAAQAQGGQTVAVVAHSGVISAMLCMCLGLGQDRVSMFRSDCGGMTIIEFPFGDVSEQNGTIRCINYTAHMGRWAIPVTRENLEDMVCGLDGCF